MLNSIIVMGRLTADPELRSTSSGLSVTSFTVAVDRGYVRAGEEKKADFIPVVAWRQTADFVSKYFRKGSMIAVQGSLQSRSYEDKNGNKRVSAEIIVEEVSFVGGGTENATEAKFNAPTASQTYLPGAFGGKQTAFEDIPTDESLPF